MGEAMGRRFEGAHHLRELVGAPVGVENGPQFVDDTSQITQPIIELVDLHPQCVSAQFNYVVQGNTPAVCVCKFDTTRIC
jgi:hypothetical protein